MQLKRLSLIIFLHDTGSAADPFRFGADVFSSVIELRQLVWYHEGSLECDAVRSGTKVQPLSTFCRWHAYSLSVVFLPLRRLLSSALVVRLRATVCD